MEREVLVIGNRGEGIAVVVEEAIQDPYAVSGIE